MAIKGTLLQSQEETFEVNPQQQQLAHGQLDLETSQVKVEMVGEGHGASSLAKSVHAFAKAGLEKATDLVGQVSGFFSAEQVEISEQAGVVVAKAHSDEPMNNTMRFLFGVIDLMALDTVEAVLNAKNLRQDILQNLEVRNSRGHTLSEALNHQKYVLEEKQLEVEKRRSYHLGFFDATGPEEETEESRSKFEATLKAKTALVEKSNKSDRKRMQPTIQKIDRLLEQLEALKTACPF